MKIKLPDNVVTTGDLKDLGLELHQYARWYSQASVKKRVTGKQSAGRPELSPAADELLSGLAKDQPLSQKTLDELLAALEHYAAEAPLVTITLAAPPPVSLKQGLAAWCRQNIGAGTLVNFKFNSTILGGLVVAYGSHVYDWSFRRQILAAKDKFPEILRNA